jgi:ElaB/YqjD/DUF883 family membrane-anchored ribosome-binding protein
MDDTSRRVERASPESRARTSEAIPAASDEPVGHHAGPVPQRALGDTTLAASDTSVVAAEDNERDERTSRIRGEIAQTREEMTETIDAIQEKLRPSNIVANATDRIKQAATEGVQSMTDMASETANEVVDYGREAYDTVAGEVRQNPIPLAMIGIGAAWLLMGHSRGAERYRRSHDWSRDRDHRDHRGRSEGVGRQAHRERSSRVDDDDQANEYRTGGGITSAVTDHPIPAALAAMGLAWFAFSDRGGRSSSSGGWTGERWVSNEEWRRQYREVKRQTPGGTGTRTGAAEGGPDRASGGVYGSVKESAEEMASTAQEYAGRAQEYAGEAMQSVQRRGRRAQSDLERLLHENPLLVGAGALAVGAIVGMTLPETEQENEWMGEARDSVVERAESMARDAATKVQDAAGEIVGDVASRVAGSK